MEPPERNQARRSHGLERRDRVRGDLIILNPKLKLCVMEGCLVLGHTTGAPVAKAKPVVAPGEMHGSLTGTSPDTRRCLTVDNFRTHWGASNLCQASQVNPSPRSADRRLALGTGCISPLPVPLATLPRWHQEEPIHVYAFHCIVSRGRHPKVAVRTGSHRAQQVGTVGLSGVSQA